MSIVTTETVTVSRGVIEDIIKQIDKVIERLPQE